MKTLESTAVNEIYLVFVDSGRRRYIAEEIKKMGKGNITAQALTFRDLCAATQNFNPDCLLGEGGFGRVYKGKIEEKKQVRNGLLQEN